MSGQRRARRGAAPRIALSFLVALVLCGCACRRAAPPRDLTLTFHPFVGAEPLRLSESRHPNPGGDGQFVVRDFQFFLSNIRLTSASGGADAHAEPDSYHLVRFDGDEPAFSVVLHDVPPRAYDRIEFGIGVDAAANKSLEQRGDLDPNGRMAWTWEVGYKFVLLEGSLTRGDASVPLVYHVGFDESYTRVSIPLAAESMGEDPARLDFRVDVEALFKGASTIDMAALPSVKFDRHDAALLAGNLGGLITPMPAAAP